MGFLETAGLLVAVAVVLIWAIRTNLEQREISRHLRTIFITEASDLIGKPEFPDRHALMLAGMSALPQGWATRFFVLTLFKQFLFSEKKKRSTGPNFEQVPHQLRKKYVLAMLAFALSDSYRCVFFGRIFRATNSWISEAVEEPKEDINAHATKVVIEQVSLASSRKSPMPEIAMAVA
jgi:hypothetical protein